MEISIKIDNPSWEVVYKIPKNTPLAKGRHGLYHEIVSAAGKIQERFGCYSWSGTETIFYVGSFSKDHARGNYKSNLHGRIHNYLQNHRLAENGRKNTNLMVFEKINSALQSGDVNLSIFRFSELQIGVEKVHYEHYSEDAELVRAVEQLLICSYKRKNQCAWNRG